jgi:hypothetical protein
MESCPVLLVRKMVEDEQEQDRADCREEKGQTHVLLEEERDDQCRTGCESTSKQVRPAQLSEKQPQILRLVPARRDSLRMTINF